MSKTTCLQCGGIRYPNDVVRVPVHPDPVDVTVRRGTLEYPSCPMRDEQPLVVADHQLEVPVAGRLQGGAKIILNKL